MSTAQPFATLEGRFGMFVDDVIANYPTTLDATVDPRWYVGAEHLTDHESFPRIVAWFTAGKVRAPAQGAISRTDIAIARRVLDVHLSVWAATRKRLEDMIHVLEAAIDAASGSAYTVAEVAEQWFPAASSLVSGGYAADVSFQLAIEVLESDAAVITAAATPGDGTPATAVTSMVLGSTLESTALPDVTTTE